MSGSFESIKRPCKPDLRGINNICFCNILFEPIHSIERNSLLGFKCTSDKKFCYKMLLKKGGNCWLKKWKFIFYMLEMIIMVPIIMPFHSPISLWLKWLCQWFCFTQSTNWVGASRKVVAGTKEIWKKIQCRLRPAQCMGSPMQCARLYGAKIDGDEELRRSIDTNTRRAIAGPAPPLPNPAPHGEHHITAKMTLSLLWTFGQFPKDLEQIAIKDRKATLAKKGWRSRAL